jgi:hypothetical protein
MFSANLGFWPESRLQRLYSIAIDNIELVPAPFCARAPGDVSDHWGLSGTSPQVASGVVCTIIALALHEKCTSISSTRLKRGLDLIFKEEQEGSIFPNHRPSGSGLVLMGPVRNPASHRPNPTCAIRASC